MSRNTLRVLEFRWRGKLTESLEQLTIQITIQAPTGEELRLAKTGTFWLFLECNGAMSRSSSTLRASRTSAGAVH